MGKFTKISQSTFDTLELDAGVILKTFSPDAPAEPNDADIVCATTGGINATCTPTYSDWGSDVDNAPANTKELKHLDGWEAKLAFAAISVTPETIKMALGAADVSGTQITPRRDLKQTDFTDVIWWVGDLADGGMVAVKLMNALGNGFSLQTSKNSKGQLTVELTGHVSIAQQDKVPMEFYVAKKGA